MYRKRAVYVPRPLEENVCRMVRESYRDSMSLFQCMKLGFDNSGA